MLYVDLEIEKLIEKHRGKTESERHFLKVVPSGESYPLTSVFEILGLNESRQQEESSEECNFVISLHWHLSPSYELSAITATNDPANEGLMPFDSRRKVYGLTIENRPCLPQHTSTRWLDFQ